MPIVIADMSYFCSVPNKTKKFTILQYKQNILFGSGILRCVLSVNRIIFGVK